MGEFALLMLGAGAFGAAGGAALGAPFWLQVVIFSVVSIAGLFGLRPYLKRRLLHSTTEPTLDHKALVGSTATVIEQVTTSQGQIKLDGSLWSARTPDPNARLLPGDRVTVADISGVTAVVWKEL